MRLKVQLAANRLTIALFDIEGYCRHTERAYIVMAEKSRRGEEPEGFDVS